MPRGGARPGAGRPPNSTFDVADAEERFYRQALATFASVMTPTAQRRILRKLRELAEGGNLKAAELLMRRTFMDSPSPTKKAEVDIGPRAAVAFSRRWEDEPPTVIEGEVRQLPPAPPNGHAERAPGNQ